MLKNYFPAKIAADECLASLESHRHPCFGGISLRPGNLTEDEGTGTVALGKTGAKGSVGMGDVARVAMALLEIEGVGTWWLDLLKRKGKVVDAVERCIRVQVECVEGVM